MTRLLQFNCNAKAQVALEYLLLLTAFFSVLLLLLPLIQQAFGLALFGFDARQASAFVHDSSEITKKLSALADGSSFSIEIMPLLEWQIVAQKNSLVVSVFSEALGKTKTFETETALETNFFSKTVKEKATIVFSRKAGKLLIDVNP